MQCAYPVEELFRDVHSGVLDVEAQGFGVSKQQDEAGNARRRVTEMLYAQFGCDDFTAKGVLEIVEASPSVKRVDGQYEVERLTEAVEDIRENLKDMLVDLTGKDLPRGDLTAKTIGRRLEELVDRPEKLPDGRLVVLRRWNQGKKAMTYCYGDPKGV